MALHTGTDSFAALKRFALIISIAAGLLFFLIVISPVGDLWFARVAGLPSELLFFVRTPALILSLAPVAVGLNALYRGVQVTWNQTPVVTKAIGINCLSLILFLLAGVSFLPYPGVVSAAVALVVSLFAETFYLALKTGSRIRNSESMQTSTRTSLPSGRDSIDNPPV